VFGPVALPLGILSILGRAFVGVVEARLFDGRQSRSGTDPVEKTPFSCYCGVANARSAADGLTTTPDGITPLYYVTLTKTALQARKLRSFAGLLCSRDGQFGERQRGTAFAPDYPMQTANSLRSPPLIWVPYDAYRLS